MSQVSIFKFYELNFDTHRVKCFALTTNWSIMFLTI